MTAPAGFGDGTASLGPIGFGVIGWLLAVGAAATVLVRHPQRLNRIPGRNRLAPLAAALNRRFGVTGVEVAALVLGFVLVAAMAVGFTALLDDVLEGEGLVRFDGVTARWLAGHREVWLTQILLFVTRMGNPASQTLWITLVTLTAAVRARSRLPIVVAVVGGLGISAVIVVAKHLVGRPRPPRPYALLSPNGLAFPSGHAAGAAAVGVLCAWMLCRWVVRRWAAQVWVWAATVALVSIIGFSRPYLGVHFVTDVLAGWMLGVAWAGAVILWATWHLWSVLNAERLRRAVLTGLLEVDPTGLGNVVEKDGQRAVGPDLEDIRGGRLA